MPDTHTRKAYMAIEDDLLQIHSAAAVLHLACGNLEDRGEAALLRSLHFTATSIETALERSFRSSLPERDMASRPAMRIAPERTRPLRGR